MQNIFIIPRDTTL